jgi:outer membrane protein TolC
MTTKEDYPGFLADMGELLKASMPRTDVERVELMDAETDVRRLQTQLANAKKRRALARERYARERGVLMEMFETWKGEVMRLPTVDDDGETPVRAIPEASDD